MTKRSHIVILFTDLTFCLLSRKPFYLQLVNINSLLFVIYIHGNKSYPPTNTMRFYFYFYDLHLFTFLFLYLIVYLIISYNSYIYENE